MRGWLIVWSWSIGQRLVRVRAIPQVARHERLARDGGHGREHARVADAARAQLVLEHRRPRGGEWIAVAAAVARFAVLARPGHHPEHTPRSHGASPRLAPPRPAASCAATPRPRPPGAPDAASSPCLRPRPRSRGMANPLNTRGPAAAVVRPSAVLTCSSAPTAIGLVQEAAPPHPSPSAADRREGAGPCARSPGCSLVVRSRTNATRSDRVAGPIEATSWAQRRAALVAAAGQAYGAGVTEGAADWLAAGEALGASDALEPATGSERPTRTRPGCRWVAADHAGGCRRARGRGSARCRCHGGAGRHRGHRCRGRDRRRRRLRGEEAAVPQEERVQEDEAEHDGDAGHEDLGDPVVDVDCPLRGGRRMLGRRRAATPEATTAPPLRPLPQRRHRPRLRPWRPSSRPASSPRSASRSSADSKSDSSASPSASALASRVVSGDRAARRRRRPGRRRRRVGLSAVLAAASIASTPSASVFSSGARPSGSVIGASSLPGAAAVGGER